MASVLGEAGESFIRGLRDPSWASLLLALATCTAALWSGAKFVTEPFFVSQAEIFTVAEDSRPVELARNLLAIADDIDCPPMVVFIGDWSPRVMEQITPMISHRSDRYTRLDLCYRDQTIWESAGLADRLPVGVQGLAIIDASARRLSAPLQQFRQVVRSPRMPLRSRAFDKEVLLAGLTCPSLSGNFFWDNQAFFVRRAPTVFGNVLMGTPIFKHDQEETDLGHFDVPRRTEEEVEPRADVLRRLVEGVCRRTELNCLLVYSRTSSVSEEWNRRCVDALKAIANSPRVRLAESTDQGSLGASILGEIQNVLERDSGEAKP